MGNYIGKEPVNGFFTRQSLTTDGSTVTFTLNFTIASTTSILVLAGGVVQEPDVAYTLSGGGTAITFTTAPASNTDTYIHYLGQAILQTLQDFNGTELILDVDADTTIHADTDDEIDFKIGGSDVITFKATGIHLPDGEKYVGGTGDDLQLYHDGSNSYLANSTGELRLATLTSGIAIAIGHSTSEVTFGDNVTVTGNLTIGGTTNFGDFNITNVGSIALDTITNDGTDITLDSSGDIILDAAGNDIFFKAGGTTIGEITNSSSDLVIKSSVSDKDILIKGNDGGSAVTALTLDMSDAGAATFNDKITVGDGKLVLNSTAVTSTAAELNLLDGVSGLVQADLTKLAALDATAAELNLLDGDTSATATTIVDADRIILNDNGTMKQVAVSDLNTYTSSTIAADDVSIGDAAVTITTSSGDITIDAAANDSDIIIKGTDGGVDTTFLTIDGSAAGAATFNDKIVATELDISGNVDIDGTLEADAITVDGTTLAEFISDTTGAMFSSNTETGITVTYQDGDNTIDLALAAAQTTITSLLATDIKIGEDDQTKIDFETADQIHFYAANANQISLADGVLNPVTDSDVDLGTASLYYKNAYIDAILTTGNITSPGNVLLSVDTDADDVSADSATGRLSIGAGQDLNLYHGGTNSYIVNETGSLLIHTDASDADIVITGNDGGADVTALTIDMSASGQFHFQDGTAALPILSNAGDTDTGLLFSDANVMSFSAGGTAQFTMADGAISPVTNNDVDLGTASLQYKNVYVDGTTFTDAIGFGTVVMTLPTADGNADQILTTDGSGTLSFVDNSGGTSWVAVKTGAYTASAGEGVFANTTGSAWTLTLPAGSIGDEVSFIDYAGTFDSNALTIAANGSEKILGSTDDLTVTVERAANTLVYTDGTQGWLLKSK